MVTETEIEAVVAVLNDAPAAHPFDDEALRKVAREAIAALDRVRSRPAGGTQDKDHDPRLALKRLRAHNEAKDAAPSPASGTEPDTAKGEETCRRCGGPNRPWAAPSPLWNAVMRGGSIDGHEEFDGIICPTCFVVLAEERGIACGWWVEADTVIAELEMVTPSGRTWDPVARRWVEAELSVDTSPESDTAKLVKALKDIRTFTGEGPHTRMGEACGIDACIGCLIYATADEALAEFSVDAAEAGGTT